MFNISINEPNRHAWLKRTLSGLPAGLRLLDAGAGELQNRQHCRHLEYVSQDFCQYEGQEARAPAEGLQIKSWSNSRIDLVPYQIPASMSFYVARCLSIFLNQPMRWTSLLVFLNRVAWSS
jgi:hypothetical protein